VQLDNYNGIFPVRVELVRNYRLLQITTSSSKAVQQLLASLWILQPHSEANSKSSQKMPNIHRSPEVDHYAMLGVSKIATPATIRRAYHESVRMSHPDKFANASVNERVAAEEQTKLLNHSYEVLSDSALRATYDQGRMHTDELEHKPQTETTRKDKTEQQRTGKQDTSQPSRKKRAPPPEPESFPRTGTSQYARFGSRPQSESVPEQPKKTQPPTQTPKPKQQGTKVSENRAPRKAPEPRRPGSFEYPYLPGVVPNLSDSQFMSEDFMQTPPWAPTRSDGPTGQSLRGRASPYAFRPESSRYDPSIPKQAKSEEFEPTSPLSQEEGDAQGEVDGLHDLPHTFSNLSSGD
jgi:curved DNA-binding protein CbpA